MWFYILLFLRCYQTLYFVCLCVFSLQRQMIVRDKMVKEQNDAKNAVEEYVYDLRDKLCGVYEKYITEKVGAAFLRTFIILVTMM